jgi:fatty acid desaturase
MIVFFLVMKNLAPASGNMASFQPENSKKEGLCNFDNKICIDEQIYRIPKSDLRDKSGQTYSEFKRKLTPKYFVVWRDIVLSYVALGVVSAALISIHSARLWIVLLSIPLGAFFIGFIFAYLNLFFHEAAHWNLARNRDVSDGLADFFVGTFFGQSIKAYRTVHFGHHQNHGTPADSEHSYFDALNMRFFVGALFGVRAFQVARKRENFADAAGQGSKSASKAALVRGLLVNGLIVGGSIWAGYWAFAVAWTAGLASVFPFFNATRQLLEHRDELANDSVNYAEVAHGRINRLFGDSLLAQTLGGAGFNRHLLHHWEPQVSYTRLAELEAFVFQTPYAELFQRRQTTYSRTFLQLIKLSSV